MKINLAKRLVKLPPYLFAEIDRLRDEVAAKGVEIIDLGVGDPDLPSPDFVVAALAESAKNPATHKYPAYSGMSHFREVAAAWYARRFGPRFNPSSEVITLIGSKEGLAHFPLAFIDPGDVVLIPSPAYPVYYGSTVFAGGEPYQMPLLKENGFLPDLEAIPGDVLQRAKLLIINYPNNPTAAVADLDFFRRVVDFACQHGLAVISDAAYTEMTYDGYTAPSFLEVDGAREVGIEFHSLSKTYNMTGWRIAFAVGNSELVSALGRVKSQIDSGAFDAVQLAGIAALEKGNAFIKENRTKYRARRDFFVKGLREQGLEADLPQATFYVWCSCPPGMKSADFAMLLLTECGIVSTPGNGFGESGEGYVRFALTVEQEMLQAAVSRLGTLGL